MYLTQQILHCVLHLNGNYVPTLQELWSLWSHIWTIRMLHHWVLKSYICGLCGFREEKLISECMYTIMQVAFQLQLLHKYEHYESLILHFWSQPHTTHFSGCYALRCELCLQTPIVDISQRYKSCYIYRKAHKTPTYSVYLCAESTVVGSDQEDHWQMVISAGVVSNVLLHTLYLWWGVIVSSFAHSTFRKFAKNLEMTHTRLGMCSA